MAYIHKMTVYFVDPNEESSAEEIEELIDNEDYLPAAFVASAETKSFEWDDDVVVNKCSATKKDYENFFNNLD